jgi:hypothetical protein
MSTVLGPNTRSVLHLIFHLRGLRAEQVDTVATEWKRRPAQVRARAWAEVTHAARGEERFAILAAATLARHDAMATAARNNRADWAFWAAAWDAAAAVASCGLIEERDYQVLVGPMAGVMRWLANLGPDRLEASGLQAAIDRLGGAR